MDIFLKNKLGPFLLFGSLIFIFFLAFSSRVLADSEIYFTDFSTEKSSFNPAEEIKGSFTLWNYENSFVPDLTYGFKLLAKDEEGYFSIVWDDQPSGDNFSLSSDQKLNKSFVYHLPKTLSAGDYKFEVRVCNASGVLMNLEDISITIKKTEGTVLILQSGNFLKNGEKAGEETLYDPSETPKITFDILNKSSSVVKAYPVITIYRDNVAGSPVKEIKRDVISLNPGYVQNEKTDLIQLADPNAHICQVVMHDQNGDPVSNAIYLRWAISESGGTEITQTKTDQSSYKPGEEASVSVDIGAQVGGTAEKGDVLVKVINDQKEVVGETKKEIDLKGGEVNIGVPITKGVSNPKIEVTIVDKQNKKLDQYPTNAVTTTGPEKEPASNAWLIAGCLIVIALATFIVVIFSRKKRTPLGGAMIFVLALTGLFLGNIQGVNAKDIVSSGPVIFDLDIAYWHNPLPLYLYNAGGYVPFSGGIEVKNSPWKELENTQIDFFVGNLIDPVLKTDLVTGIKSIDENNSQNMANLIKLGTVPGHYFIDEGMVKYEVSLKIPQDLPYTGKSRFYVQFKGQDTQVPVIDPKPWSWLVAYQEVEIQKFTEGGFDVKLTTDKASAKAGDIVTYTVNVNNKSSCITIPVDLAMILDRSGSMNGSPLDAAKTAAKAFVDVMNPNSLAESLHDRMALVDYGTGSNLGLHSTTTFSSVKSAIDAITVNGNTCIACGIKTASDELAATKRPEAIQYEVLMTDGITNTCLDGTITGDYSQQPRDEAMEQAMSSGARIFTVGFGSGADETLLKDIADSTNGFYSYAPDPQALKNNFEAIAGVLVGKSLGTKVKVSIPTEYFTVEEYDQATCDLTDDPDNIGNKLLTCSVGDLDCLNNTDGNPSSAQVKFKLKVNGDIPDDVVVDTEAEVTNDSGQKKSDESEVTIIAKNPPQAEISCDSGECGTGCSDCCQCYTDSILKLINDSKANGNHSNIEVSTWYTKKQGDPDSAYEVKLSELGKVDFPYQKLAVGNYTVELKVTDTYSLSASTTKNITYFQGVEAGFVCSMDGTVWHSCEDPNFRPAKGERVWLSDSQMDLEHSMFSSGAGTITRQWSTIKNSVKSTFSSSQNDDSAVSTILEDLPTVIRLELNDGNRPKTVSKDHSINIIPLPTWIETSPF